MDEYIEALVEEGWDVAFWRVIVGDVPMVRLNIRRGGVSIYEVGHNSKKLIHRAFSQAVVHTPRLSDLV